MSTQFIVIIGVGTFFLFLTWWAFIDLAYKDFGSLEKKALWAFIVFIPFIGCMVYLCIGRKTGQKKGINV